MAKRWVIHPHDPDRIVAVQRVAGVSAVVAQLLLCRGISDPVAARDFLDPKLSGLLDPDALPGCREAAARIHQAVAAHERIVVHGDYDVDGMAGSAILWLCLRMLGADCRYYIPHRLEDGYGLSETSIRNFAREGIALVVTVDCGIQSVGPAAVAKALGLTLIVTDHHEPGGCLPEAAAIVHPRLPGAAYPFGDLSGAGVAMKLAWALCQQASGAKRVAPRMKDFLLQAVGLAALGTIADVVPLVGENRILVKHGLPALLAHRTPGLAALLEVAKLQDKRELEAEDVAFTLAPRLNAAGRLGQPQLAVELLVTDRPDRAAELARYIDQLNASRQTLERSIYLAANKQIQQQFDPAEDAALVLAERGWHAGVIGIVAGRLVEKYHRPVVLIAWDQLGVNPGVGSARSVPGFKLHEALAACTEHLVVHGGHAAAAGLKIHEAVLEQFRADFCRYAADAISDEDRQQRLAIDAEVPLSAFTLQSVEQMERLAPFGQGNARPLLCTSGVTLAGPPQTMGGGRHLSLRLCQHGVTLRAVAFGAGEQSEELAAMSRPLDIAFRPCINRFRGRATVELQLVDWRA